MSYLPQNELSASNSQTVDEYTTLDNIEMESGIFETNENVSSSDSKDSASSNGDSSSEDESNPTYGIYLHSTLIFSKQNSEFITDDKKNACKIIKFNPDWKMFEIIKQIRELHDEDFPNLLITIFEFSDIRLIYQQYEDKSSKKVKTNYQQLKSALKKLYKNRPLILHITSQNENSSELFYKCLNDHKFQQIMPNSTSSDFFTDFPSFLWMLLAKNSKKFIKSLCRLLTNDTETSNISDFLVNSYTNADILKYIIVGCAYNISIIDITTIINFQLFDENGEINSNIKNFFASKTEQLNAIILPNTEWSNNKKICQFIVRSCTKMIGNFDYSFQLNISTIAFEKDQLDFLCDLVDVCDFPFPRGLDIASVTHERLKQIIDKRVKFNEAITNNNEQEIKTFIDSHPNLKFIYNPRNCSALHQAISAKKIKLFGYLEQHGLKAPEYSDYCNASIDEKNKKTAKQLAIKQRNDNVKGASPIFNKTTLLLLTKSFIHNKNLNDETQTEYWNKIGTWFENIYKIEENKPHLDTISQCERLKIIFDFDSDEVDNIDPLNKGAEGVMYPSSKWIFIGAKYLDEDEDREPYIEGVVAHETDHFALELNYGNNSNPYLKDDIERQQKYEEIVENINEWKSVDISDPDDECGGIISSVFKLYPADCYHAELIVRVPQILTRYSRNKNKLVILEKRYKPLFDFYRKYILKDLKKISLNERQEIREFNKLFGKLAEIQNCKYEFSNLQDMSHLLTNHITIVSTYIPILLLINIQKNLSSKYLNLLDTKCIFIDSENLKNGNVMKKLQEIIKNSSELNVIVYSVNGNKESFKKLINNQEVKFTFVLPDDQSSENLAQVIKIYDRKSVSYSWNDLSSKTQDELLETKANLLKDPVQIRELITFKNKKSVLEKDTLTGTKVNAQTIPCEEYLHPPSGELFKMLVEKSEIKIEESPIEDENDEKNISVHYLKRKFNKYQTTVERSKNNVRNDSELVQKSSHSKLQNTKDNFEFLSNSNQNSNEELYDDDQSLTERDLKIDIEPKIKIIETKMILEEFLKDVANKMIIVIADSAGTGKTWTTKNLTKLMRKQSPRKWTTRVDLKQFIEHFKSNSDIVVDFSEFMIKSILRLKTNIDKDLFRRMYIHGRACIFFDGFDEITPNYAKFVMKLIKSFEFNNGNQLWIATRDNFEIDLQKELNLDVFYKLEPFTHHDGINLMTSILVLHDLESNSEVKSGTDDIQTEIKNHPDYETFKKKAADLNKIISDLNTAAIGAPQFYQMIAKIFISKGAESSAMTVVKIFEEFVNIQYEKWAFYKGEIRHRANISSQKYNLNYMGLHQFFAMKGSYPNVNRFCELVFNTEEWPVTEIIACGLLVLRNGEFQFHHETFREFFISQFITRILKRDKEHVNEEFCNYLRDVLTLPKFEVVRVFLNECLAEHQPYMQQIISKIASNINKWSFLLDIYKNNLENLQKMWNIYFHSLHYYKLKNILFSDMKIFLDIAENKDLCKKFLKFLHVLMKPKDLLEMILIKNEHGDNFIHLAVYYNEFHDIKILIESHNQIFEKSHFEAILKSKGCFRQNLLQKSAIVSKDVKTFEYLWNVFQNMFNSHKEFLAFLKEVDDNRSNIFNLAAAFTTSKVFEFMIDMLKKITSVSKIKEFLSSLGKAKRNLLQAAARQNKSSEFHNSLWKIIREYFDSDEILEMIIHNDEYGNNLLHNAILGDDAQIIELTWNEITATVNSCNKIQNKSSKLEATLKSKGYCGQNLLHKAAIVSKHVNTFEYLWSIFQKIFKSEEKLMTILKEVNDEGNNIFRLAASFTTDKIFKFMMEVLKKLGSAPQIKEFLSSKGFFKRNLLQAAAKQNKSSKFYKLLWTIMREYFNSDEILEMITHTDEYGNNLLQNSVLGDDAQIIELTWNEITATVNSCKSIQNKSSKLKEILKSRGENGRNFFQIATIASKNIIAFVYVWSIFKYVMISYEDFLAFLNNVDDDGSNTFYLSAAFATNEVFEFTVRIVKKHISSMKIEKFLSSLGKDKRNLLQAAAKQNRSYKFHKSLWRIIREYFDSDDILEMILHTDEYGNNLLHTAVLGNIAQIIKLTFIEITATVNSSYKIKNKSNKLKEILKSKGQNERNLLQMAAIASKDIITFEYLWIIIKNKIISDEEFLAFLEETDDEGNNFFNLAAAFTTSEIFEFIFIKLKKLILRPNIKGIQISIEFFKRNLLQAAVTQNKTSKFHKNLWMMMREYFNSDEILEMITYNDEYGNNLLHNAVLADNAQIVKLTWNEITTTVNSCKSIQNKSSKLKEILISKGQNGRNLLQMAAVESKDIITFEYIWIIIKNVIISDIVFLALLRDVDVQENNIFRLSASFTTSEIFKLMIEMLKKCTTRSEIKKFLSSTGGYNRNLLQAAARQNNSSKFYNSLWIIMKEYFDPDEILEMIIHTDVNKYNLLHNAVLGDNAQIVKLTWNGIIATVNSCDKIKKKSKKFEEILMSKGKYDENILQLAVRISKNKKTHQILWNILLGLPILCENLIWDQTKPIGNILHFAIVYGTKEICELTWSNITKIITTENRIRFLKEINPKGLNIYSISFWDYYFNNEVYKWVIQVFKEYNIKILDTRCQ